MSFVARNHPQQVAVRGALSAVDDLETDPALFAQLHARFGFTVDVAASATNAKLPRFIDRMADGLRQSWAGEMVWCNPPYSSIAPWIEKAWAEHHRTRGIVMLLPANRTEQRWWQDLVEPHRDNGSSFRVEFLAGRRRFIKAGADGIGANERPPFGCCLLIWDRQSDWTMGTDGRSNSSERFDYLSSEVARLDVLAAERVRIVAAMHALPQDATRDDYIACCYAPIPAQPTERES